MTWRKGMYGLWLEPWLETFPGRQFCVLPMRWALKERAEAIWLILGLGANLALTSAMLEANGKSAHLQQHLNSKGRTSIEAELGPELLSWFRETYAEPTVEHLSEMLARSMRSGLAMGGYTPDRADAVTPADVKRHLAKTW